MGVRKSVLDFWVIVKSSFFTFVIFDFLNLAKFDFLTFTNLPVDRFSIFPRTTSLIPSFALPSTPIGAS